MLKTKRIGLIVTEEEKSWVVNLAKLEGGLSQASLIRRLIHQAAEHHKFFTTAERQNLIDEKFNERPFTENQYDSRA